MIAEEACWQVLIWPLTIIIVVAIVGGVWLEDRARRREPPRKVYDQFGEEIRPGD